MNNDLLILGETNYRNNRKRFGILKEDRRRHMYIVGKTGMGKSTLLLNCIVQDIQRGNGVAVLDPHGDLVERLLDYVPPRRINETIYFNPADTEHPIAFNPLYHKDHSQRHLVASGLIQVFKKIWADSWGPRLEYVLRNAILALLEKPGNTLLGIPRLLTDDRFRQKIIRGIKDPVVRHFWEIEFEQYPKVFRTETISPIQNKVGQFLSTPIIRNIVGQTKTRFDLSDVLDSGKILLMNLSKGKIGEDNSSLLGALMITQIYLAAVKRASIPETNRRDFYLYVDELQSFATEEFPSILSEARKYCLNVVVANQFVSQLPEIISSSLLGNVGTIVSFAIGSEDAELLAEELQPVFRATDLIELPKHTCYLKLSINGSTSPPFSAAMLPATIQLQGTDKSRVETQSHQRYCRQEAKVAANLIKWLST